ncbi:MAG: thymidylate kinase, partial [Methanobacterium sp.]
EAVKRLQSRDNQEMFENLQDLIKVRRKALKLAQKWHIAIGNCSIENIQKQINSVLDHGNNHENNHEND